VFGITSKVLTQQLRELEKSGLVHREVYRETPRRIEYSVTNYGKTLQPITELMCEWGKSHLAGFECGLLDLGGLQILIATDPTLGELLRAALEIRHAQVEIATSASAALMLFRQTKPDILVIDVTLTNNEGFELIEQIRALEAQEDSRIPAIALTTQESTDRRQAIRAGFQVHLVKPIEVSELATAIATLTS
jgi:CheY-like chemotaxis protein